MAFAMLKWKEIPIYTREFFKYETFIYLYKRHIHTLAFCSVVFIRQANTDLHCHTEIVIGK